MQRTLGPDVVLEGTNAGVEMKRILESKGNVVILEVTVGSSPANDFQKGFMDEIADTEIKVLASQSGDFTRVGGKEVIESFHWYHVCAHCRRNDISIASTLAFTGIMSAFLLQQGMPAVLVILVALSIGIGFGVFQGVLINNFYLQPFIITLAGQFLMRGMCSVVSTALVGTFMGVLIQGLIQVLIIFQGTLSSWWTKVVIAALLCIFIMLQQFIFISSQKIGGKRINIFVIMATMIKHQ